MILNSQYNDPDSATFGELMVFSCGMKTSVRLGNVGKYQPGTHANNQNPKNPCNSVSAAPSGLRKACH